MFNLPETIFVDSSGLRANYADRDHLLDKVKKLSLLPDNLHATTELVARYYEVPVETIKSVVEDNAEEVAANGRRVLKGAELRDFAGPFGGLANLGLHHNARSLAIFSRRAVLNVGMLLRDSQVARALRTYLLNVEQLAPQDQRAQALRVRYDEKFDYSRLRDVVTTAVDYQPGTEYSDLFFARMQNYFYLCVTGMKAAQLKRVRPVDPALCTRFRKDGVTPLAVEKQSAKNRLSMDELADINSLVLGAIARLSYRSRQAVRAGRGWTLAEVEQNVCWAVEELVKG